MTTDARPAVAREDDDITPQPSPCRTPGHTITRGVPCDACIRNCIEPGDYERVLEQRALLERSNAVLAEIFRLGSNAGVVDDVSLERKRREREERRGEG